MAMDGELHALAEKALELEAVAPLIAHDPKDCENCAEYQAEFLAFARDALPKLARGYIELVRTSLEAFENAKLRGRFLADLEEENARLQKELTAREAELEELQAQPVKRKWLR
jgi:LPS O-antigen subunit length determinant protein (WzzB/FepE family)